MQLTDRQARDAVACQGRLAGRRSIPVETLGNLVARNRGQLLGAGAVLGYGLRRGLSDAVRLCVPKTLSAMRRRNRVS